MPLWRFVRAGFAAAVWVAALGCGGGSTGEGDVRWYTADPGALGFKISTADELAGLAALVNDSGVSFDGRVIRLARDIDLSEHYGKSYNEGKGWIPIGLTIYGGFIGVFDGNGKKVSGLYISDTTNNMVGLFGGVGYSLGKAAVGVTEIRNLGVVGVDVRGGNYVGGVVGSASGRLVNCYSTGAVRGRQGVGGVLGSDIVLGDSASVVGCHSSCAVSSDSGYAGGVVGFLWTPGRLAGCYSTGAVSGGAGWQGVGGVAGFVKEGSVSNAYSTGAVSGNRGVGGVVGVLGSGGGLVSSYSAGAVSGNAYVGGVVGAGPSANCAALNPSVGGAVRVAGRVSGAWGGGSSVGNVAFSGTINAAGGAEWDAGEEEAVSLITAAEISADGSVRGLFTPAAGWVTHRGRLPGLAASGAVEMPKHLRP